MKRIRYFILFFLFIITVSIWSSLFAEPANDLLEVHFFDVGQGDAIFIEYKDFQILIDGGPDSSVIEKLASQMDFFDRHIDVVISTHPDVDHLTGLLSVLSSFEVDLVLTNGLPKKTASFAKWTELIEKKEINVKVAQAGQKIELGQGIYLNILWPESMPEKIVEETNNYSVVVQLVYNEAEFLFTGDIEKKTELKLANRGIESDVLKISHHGSRGSTNPLFLKKVDPDVAVISVGDNSYGHPTDEVLERLSEISVLRTDLSGDLKFVTDGQTLNMFSSR